MFQSMSDIIKSISFFNIEVSIQEGIFLFLKCKQGSGRRGKGRETNKQVCRYCQLYDETEK